MSSKGWAAFAAMSLIWGVPYLFIKVVVDDCGFSDAPGVISTTFEHFVGLPPFPFAPLSVKIAEWRTGARLSQVRPVDVVGRLAPGGAVGLGGDAEHLHDERRARLERHVELVHVVREPVDPRSTPTASSSR